MKPVSTCLAWLALSALCAPGCGARTGLYVDDHGASRDAGTDADADVDQPDAPLPEPCTLAAAGDPVSFLSFPGRSADAPDLVVLDPGSPSGPRDAVVAVKARDADANFWHPEIHMARVIVGEPWPAGLVIDRALTRFVYESHEWGTLARAAGPGHGLAMFWHYAGALVDPPSLRFQTFDTVSWSAAAPVDVIVEGGYGASLALAPGRGVDGTGSGFAGDGYAIAVRFQQEDMASQPVVAILDATGHLALGPFPIAPPEDYPGRAAGVVWTGTTYLVSTSFDQCLASAEVFCVPRSVALLQIVPPRSADDPGGLEAVAWIGSSRPDLVPARAYLSEHAGTVWMMWTEGDPERPELGRVVRLVRASRVGDFLDEPRTIAEGAQPTTVRALSASRHGVIALWGEQGDTSLPLHEPGYSRVVVLHHDLEGNPVQDPIELAATSLAYYTGLSVAPLDRPEGVLLTWAAKGPEEALRDEIYLTRLGCLP